MAYSDTPLPTDTPAFSQNLIRQNFLDIASRWSVDHIPLTSGIDLGEHKKVTFALPLAGDPGLASPTASLYTKTVAGLSQLFFQNGPLAADAIQILGPISAIGNGYIAIGGIYFQWGHRVVANTLPVPFNIAFPNACFTVVLTADSTGSQYNVTGLTPSQFSWASNPGGGNAQFYWVAIGN